MKILYVASKYDYGDPSRGYSYEHYNFYETLVQMGHEIVYFDSATAYKQFGKACASKRLLDTVKAEKPELLFCVLTMDELDIDTITHISRSTDTTTYNWFSDDIWRFEIYTRHWAPAFNWVSTTALNALPKYRQLGYNHVIKTQFAFNHHRFRHLDVEQLYDVTFVGQPHGTRRQIIDTLRRMGIDVHVWGHGWESGRLSQDEMIRVFNQSRINLNLTNASTRGDWKRWSPWHSSITPKQIKGRNFEVPGCGAFILTDMAEDLEEYYNLDKEIGAFTDEMDLVSQIRFYLDSTFEREQTAQRGYRRTVEEHSYEKRFSSIFREIRLGSTLHR